MLARTPGAWGDRVHGWASFPALKMFDGWNEEGEVRDVRWEVLNETEDHSVPSLKGNEDDTPWTFKEYSKKQRHEQTSTNLSITNQGNFVRKNDFPGSSNFNLHRKEELSTSRFDMDTWPDLPSLNASCGKGYMERNHLHSMTPKFNDCPRSSNMEKVTENMVTKFYDVDVVLQNRDPSLRESCSLSAPDIAPLDSEPDMFMNEHEEKCDSFLDRDWANITNFDDLDRIFRNDEAIFGQEIVGNADEIFSVSMDVDNARVSPFPMPVISHNGGSIQTYFQDIPISKDNSAEKEFSRFEFDGQSRIEILPLENDKVDRQKMLSNFQKKMEKSRTKLQQNLSSYHPSNTSSIQQLENMKMQSPLKSSSESFQSAALCQHGEGEEHGYMGLFPGTSHHSFPVFEYPEHVFPLVPMVSPANSERKQNQAVAASQNVYPISSSNVQSEPLPMTPQEKMDKLRKRQQMQALLAIQRQQQHFGQQRTYAETSVSQTISQMNQSHGEATCGEIIDKTMKWFSSSELNVPQEGDESQNIFTLIDISLEETVFYRLQDAIGKLDAGVRLCIRDSLFRLARSARERHMASSSNANKDNRDEDETLVNEETNSHDRSTRLPTETGTNPVDRTVAHLLFHWPPESEARSVKDEMPSSPMSTNAVPEMSNTQKNAGEQTRQIRRLQGLDINIK